MSSRNRFWVRSVALVILVSGLIAPDFFVSAVYAGKPSSGGTTSRTLVEIVGTDVPLSKTVVYTVPVGQRLVLTDTFFAGCQVVEIYRDDVTVSRSFFSGGTAVRSYQSGIEFEQGQKIGVAAGILGHVCFEIGFQFYELRGYLEAL